MNVQIAPRGISKSRLQAILVALTASNIPAEPLQGYGEINYSKPSKRKAQWKSELNGRKKP